MYDIVFIDDKFEEIKKVFLDIQKEARCYYTDGYSLPENDEFLFFRNLQFICIDVMLENLGIKNINQAYPAMAEIIKSFNPNKDTKIIINTFHHESFKKEELIKLLPDNYSSLAFIIESKDEDKYSTLIKSIADIKNKSKSSFTRSFVIEESINIENILWDKVCNNMKTLVNNGNYENFEKIAKKQFYFANKINLYNLLDNSICKELRRIKEIRNDCAHEEGVNKNHLQDFYDLLKTVLQKFNL